MTTLVIAEHDGEALSLATRSTLAAAMLITGDIHLLVMSDSTGDVVTQACHCPEADRVLLAHSDTFTGLLTEPCRQQILALARQGGYSHILFPATTFGKTLAPGVAALLDVCQISDITDVLADDIYQRPVYAGNALETVRSDDPIKIITVRPSAFPPPKTLHQRQTALAPEKIIPDAHQGKTKLIRYEPTHSTRPDLLSAGVVVSGGRALGSPEAFEQLVGKLADKLGGAVGASRAAVDAGFAPNDYQVGQTGKIVAPRLYLALGISGAIQHIAGMKASDTIIAINKDPDAPIFDIADYGLVADIFEVIPELINNIDIR